MQPMIFTMIYLWTMLQLESACPSPLVSSFGVSNLTFNSAELSWLAGENEPFWSIEWGLSGFNLGTGTYDTTTNFFAYPISGLTSITSYTLLCAGDMWSRRHGYWAGPFTFTSSLFCFL